MKFKTQYEYRKKTVCEETGSVSPVVNVPVMSNTERIAQLILSGQMLEAGRVGYEYGPDDKIPDNAYPRPGRNADITTLLGYIEHIGAKLREHVASVNQKKKEAAQPVAPNSSPNAQEGVKDVSEPKT